ncbi:MAG: hypothetical protein IKQ00_02785 [Butyrivibrio sp.]|nr:hypothetical protein [Butyrivibrio sp.]
MSALISVIVLGNSIGLCQMFLVAVLLVWLCIFCITGDRYDMRSDVLASIEGICTEDSVRKEEKNIPQTRDKYIDSENAKFRKKLKEEQEEDCGSNPQTVDKKAV